MTILCLLDVRKYLSSFPELSEKDFPKFEEFDLDHDGQVRNFIDHILDINLLHSFFKINR